MISSLSHQHCVTITIIRQSIKKQIVSITLVYHHQSKLPSQFYHQCKVKCPTSLSPPSSSPRDSFDHSLSHHNIYYHHTELIITVIPTHGSYHSHHHSLQKSSLTLVSLMILPIIVIIIINMENKRPSSFNPQLSQPMGHLLFIFVIII